MVQEPTQDLIFFLRRRKPPENRITKKNEGLYSLTTQTGRPGVLDTHDQYTNAKHFCQGTNYAPPKVEPFQEAGSHETRVSQYL